MSHSFHSKQANVIPIKINKGVNGRIT